MGDVPYVGFSDNTLNKQPKVSLNTKIKCSLCGGSHKLIPCDDGRELLLFYKCGGKSYLAAIDHKLVAGLKADVSGDISVD